jgi:hypothetical protein
LGSRVEIRKRTTFNSGATPRPGETRIEPKVLAKIDIEKLGAEIAATVERSKSTDPKELQRRVRELEAQLGKPVNTEEVKMLKDTIAQLQIEEQELQNRLDIYARKHEQATELAAQLAELLSFEMPAFSPRVEEKRLQIPAVTRRPEVRAEPSDNRDSKVNLRSGARKMLHTLVMWSPSGRTEAQVAAQVGMKRTSGTWSAYKSDLRQGGYMEILSNGLWYATLHGIKATGNTALTSPNTTAQVVELWSGKLRKGAREMLDCLVERRGRTVSRIDLGAAVSLKSSSGTFSAYLSDLKQAGLIEVDKIGVRANKETLFL